MNLKNEIIELRKLGFSYNDISQRLSCAKSTISYYCSGIELNSKLIEDNRKIKNEKQKKEKSFILPSIEKINMVISLRKERKSYDEIVSFTNLSKYVISKICREYNLFSYRKRGEVYQSKEEIQQIVSLYQETKSVRKVSKILNKSVYLISKHIDILPKKKLTIDEKRKKNVKDVIEWRKKVKQKLVEYKGGECEICGYKKCIKSLEFHHKDSNEKDFTISGKSWSFEKLKKEVDKCMLLCSNCHNEIHDR